MIVYENKKSRDAIQSNEKLLNISLDEIFESYDEVVQLFHNELEMSDGLKANQVENAIYHKNRYKILIDRNLNNKKVLDIGNDKPFLTWLFNKKSPDAQITTISFPVEGNPYQTYAVDIEESSFDLERKSFDTILISEVIEHLWRNPSNTLYEMNKCLKHGGETYITTPNACELHAITNILWQAHPNQRGQYYSVLESGHLHLWTPDQLKIIVQAHGFEIKKLITSFPYGYTNLDNEIYRLAEKVSPYFDLMGETIELTAVKIEDIDDPQYPREIYPDGMPVQFNGAITSFAKNKLFPGDI